MEEAVTLRTKNLQETKKCTQPLDLSRNSRRWDASSLHGLLMDAPANVQAADGWKRQDDQMRRLPSQMQASTENHRRLPLPQRNKSLPVNSRMKTPETVA